MPAGAIDLSIAPVGYARHAMAHVVDGPRKTELVFQLTRGPAVLEGVLVGPDGGPYGDAEVVITARTGADTAAVEAITYSDGGGRFRVEHLQDGEYDVVVWTGSGETRRVARPGGAAVRIVVGGRSNGRSP